jgi:hypothetical protein
LTFANACFLILWHFVISFDIAKQLTWAYSFVRDVPQRCSCAFDIKLSLFGIDGFFFRVDSSVQFVLSFVDDVHIIQELALLIDGLVVTYFILLKTVDYRFQCIAVEESEETDGELEEFVFLLLLGF